jgi:hypothetical protein
MQAKGRHWLILWLVFALGVLVWVSARQAAGHVLAASLREARAARSAAEADRAVLLRRRNAAQSRAVLVPRAEAMGLRFPADSEVVTLQDPDGRRR